jgi:hypothetical protein
MTLDEMCMMAARYSDRYDEFEKTDGSYQDDALHLDIWLDENDSPQRGEILWQGRGILSVSVTNFVFV